MSNLSLTRQLTLIWRACRAFFVIPNKYLDRMRCQIPTPLKNAFHFGGFFPSLRNRKTSIVQFTHKSCNWHFICGFYTNWPLSRANNIQTQYREALRGPSEWSAHGETKKKLQSQIKTAINHSCWASFKYKSISIFHLEPPFFPSSNHPKKKCEAKVSSYTQYWSAYMGEICHFLRCKTRVGCRRWNNTHDALSKNMCIANES